MQYLDEELVLDPHDLRIENDAVLDPDDDVLRDDQHDVDQVELPDVHVINDDVLLDDLHDVDQVELPDVHVINDDVLDDLPDDLPHDGDQVENGDDGKFKKKRKKRKKLINNYIFRSVLPRYSC